MQSRFPLHVVFIIIVIIIIISVLMMCIDVYNPMRTGVLVVVDVFHGCLNTCHKTAKDTSFLASLFFCLEGLVLLTRFCFGTKAHLCLLMVIIFKSINCRSV